AEQVVDRADQAARGGRVQEKIIAERDAVLPLDPTAGLQQRQRLVAELLERAVQDVAVEVHRLVGAGALGENPLQVVQGELDVRHGWLLSFPIGAGWGWGWSGLSR